MDPIERGRWRPSTQNLRKNHDEHGHAKTLETLAEYWNELQSAPRQEQTQVMGGMSL